MSVRHINCGWLGSRERPVSCHCLLVEDQRRLVLVDTGVGLQDVRRPMERIGRELIEMAGFHFDEAETAIRQIERLGYDSTDVTDIVLTHGDPDHAGGLSDFPNARVHIAAEELTAMNSGHWRYRAPQFTHGVHWQQHTKGQRTWHALEARHLPLELDSEVLLIPLFGHTAGHCGAAIQQGDGWLLHVGDAYYLRVELASDDHPVSQLAAQRAVDDARRRKSLEELRRLSRDYSTVITMVGYHDVSELPQYCLRAA